jgi:hypothetical protein
VPICPDNAVTVDSSAGVIPSMLSEWELSQIGCGPARRYGLSLEEERFAHRRKEGGMSTQPVHRHEPDTPRVQHTIGGISDALRGSRRVQFFAELLRAQQGQELDDVINAWWGRAMLDTDPDRDRIHAAAVDGTLPTTTIDEARRRQQERSASER